MKVRNNYFQQLLFATNKKSSSCNLHKNSNNCTNVHKNNEITKDVTTQ